MPFFSARRPLVFAHRGGCALGPENTLAAFDLGMQAGADGLELDIHLSREGVAVVHHDPTLDRTTSASGPVSARTVTELQRIDAGARFQASDGSFPFRDRGIGVPTLEETLRRYPNVPVIIEMKEDSPEMAAALVTAVRNADAVDRICAAGFGLRSLTAVRTLLPAAATSACHPEVRLALYRSWARWPVRHVRYGGYQVPEHAGRLRVVSPQFVRHAHEAELEVQVWTVDAQADMKRLLAWGVDALITNRPDLAAGVRDVIRTA